MMDHSDRAGSGPLGFERVARWAWSVTAIAVTAAILGIVAFHLRVILIASIAALLVAAGIDPLVTWIANRGVRRGFAAAIVVVGLTGSLVLLGVWIVPSLWASGAGLTTALESLGTGIENWLASSPLHTSAADLRTFAQRAGITSGGGATLLHGLVAGATTVAEIAEGLVLTAVFTVYLLVRGRHHLDWLVDLGSGTSRRIGSIVVRVVWGTAGAYARAIAINGVINAVLIGLALVVIGVPGAGALTVITLVGGLFPVVGVVTAGLIAAVVALASRGVLGMLLVVAATTVLHHLDVYVVGPLVVGKRVQVHPVALIAVLAIGATVAGLTGLFLAPPLLVITTALIREIRNREPGHTPGTAG